MKLLILLLLTFMTIEVSASVKSASQKDKRELRCLAQNIYFEARGERQAGQLAVGLVTMNRVNSKRFPNTVCKVVWQKRQFSWTHDGKSDRPTDMKAWKLAQKIAEFV